MIDWASKAKKAAAILAKKGRTATLTHKGSSGYNTTTGVAAAANADTEDVSCVTLDFSLYEQRNANFESKTLKALFSAPKKFKPRVEDSLTIDGISYQIQLIQELAPAGIAVMYTAQVVR